MAATVMGVIGDDTGAQDSESEWRHGQAPKEFSMRIRLNYIAPALAAGATAAAITVAPIAAAAPNQDATGAGAAASSGSSQGQQSCSNLGGTQSQCQSPGNSQVYDAPPQVDYFPYAGGGT